MLEDNKYKFIDFLYEMMELNKRSKIYKTMIKDIEGTILENFIIDIYDIDKSFKDMLILEEIMYKLDLGLIKIDN